MFFYFVRHGETVNNQQRKYQSAQTPLAPEGEHQASLLAERLKEYTFTQIWTSPYLRAKQTTAIINEYHQLPITELPLLGELKRPSIFADKYPNDPSIKTLVDQYKQQSEDFDFKMADGESFREFVNRAHDFVKYAHQQALSLPQDAMVLVTAHGFIIKSILMSMMLGTLATPEVITVVLKTLKLENTGLSIVRFAADKKQLDNSHWRMVTINDFNHL